MASQATVHLVFVFGFFYSDSEAAIALFSELNKMYHYIYYSSKSIQCYFFYIQVAIVFFIP